MTKFKVGEVAYDFEPLPGMTQEQITAQLPKGAVVVPEVIPVKATSKSVFSTSVDSMLKR